MKSKAPVSWLGSLFAIVAAAHPLAAQSVAPSAKDPVVELSPFVVNSTKDTGYQATSTLAGTRLDTPLKDLGASISIYTKEFMEDIGATNTGDLLIYATGMEAAGPGGNYSATNALNDINAFAGPFYGPVRENPQGAARARGLGSPTFTRNLFTGGIPIDTYNTERVTVLRGPNAALFGVGSPAGIADTTLVQADVQRNSNKVTARIDNEFGLRTSVDFNRVLIPGKLAVRLAGLKAREEYNQRPAFESKDRIYGTFTYMPFKSTTLRGNFESGRMRANREVSVLPVNGVSQDWIAAGRPGFDWSFYDDPARNPNAANQISSNFYPHYIRQSQFQPIQIFINNPDDRAISYAMRAVIPTTTATVADSLRTQLFHPLLNRDLATDTLAFTSTSHINEFPAGTFWVGGNVLPGQLPGLIPPGVKDQGFTDFKAFDWKNRLIDESGIFLDSFRGFNVSLEQSAWGNRLGFQLGFDNQRLYRDSVASFIQGSSGTNNQRIRVDTTITLPNGAPNPNLGRPYIAVESGTRWNDNHSNDRTYRGTMFLRYDFAQEGVRGGKWLGRHLLSGVVERYERESISFQPSYRTDGPHARTIAPQILGRQAGWSVYLGSSMIGNNSPLAINPIRTGPLPGGPIGNVQYFQRAANDTDVGSFTSGPLETVLVNNGGNIQREVIRSKAVTLQSNWFEDHVVTMAGWRRDDDYVIVSPTNWVLDPANPNSPGKLVWGFNDVNFASLPPYRGGKENKSYSVVLRWPQKLFKLPARSELSVFYNNSENFTPAAGRVFASGQPAPAQQGVTEEYGLDFSAFDGKLTLRVNRFETTNQGTLYNPAAMVNISNLPLDLISAWAREGNTNPQLVAKRNADIAKLTAVLPNGADYLKAYNLTISGTAPNITVTRTNIQGGGLVDLTDYAAKGTEFEVIYNPTPNWRILANLARQETIKSNTLPFSKASYARMKPVLVELGAGPALNYPQNYQLGDPLPANVETLTQYVDRLIEVNLAIDNATNGFPAPEQREWRFNLVTNYRFGPGSFFGERLKGWSIGGGLRWQDKMVIGFPSRRLANTAPVFDREHPFYAPAETNVDLFASYGRKIWDGRIDWKVQLNATNVYTERELLPIAIQPWGQTAFVRLAPQQRFYLTNTFGF